MHVTLGNDREGDSMIEQMAHIAAEAFREPQHQSVWHPGLKKYVCPKDQGYEEAVQNPSPQVIASHPPINPTFKLVFLTAAIGTALFTVICIGTHIWVGNEQMSSSLDRTVTALLDMAKIGFGAIAGMLGGHALNATSG